MLRQFNQTVQAQKIIVVDNASTDGTHEYIEDILQSHAEQVKYLRLDENLGGSGGFYYGMKEALNEHTDLIGISDDDASYDEDYFEKIIKAAENNPKDMAFCGAMYDHGKMTAETAGTAKHLLSDNTLKLMEIFTLIIGHLLDRYFVQNLLNKLACQIKISLFGSMIQSTQ